jgi:uncharacterized protein involved in exopolysaccharide biosynthesis
LWRGKFILLAGMILCGAVGVGYAYYWATPLYRSRAIVAVQDPAPPINQLGGLASLAGIQLGNAGSRTSQRVAVLSSRRVARMLIERENLMPVLFPDRGEGALGSGLQEPPRTIGRAVDYFVNNVRTIDQNIRTGLITVDVVWKDPALAAQWVRELIDITNEILRDAAISDAQRNIDYLTQESARTTLDSARQALVQLSVTNLNEMMLAKLQDDYAFKMIDAPEVSERNRFIWPRRGRIVLGGLFFGFLLSSIFVLRYSRRSVFKTSLVYREA